MHPSTARSPLAIAKVLSYSREHKDEPWNVVVFVGYPAQARDAGIAPRFERIRGQHTTVPVDGRSDLSALGRIVDSRALQPACTSSRRARLD